MAKKIVLDAGHGLELASNKGPDGSDEWTLTSNVPGYKTATDALADLNMQVSVLAGQY